MFDVYKIGGNFEVLVFFKDGFFEMLFFFMFFCFIFIGGYFFKGGGLLFWMVVSLCFIFEGEVFFWFCVGEVDGNFWRVGGLWRWVIFWVVVGMYSNGGGGGE